jgi:hypothetical protein
MSISVFLDNVEKLTTHRTEIATMRIVQNHRSHPVPITVVTQLTRSYNSTGWRRLVGVRFINDERNRSHFEHNGLGKTNIL